MNRLWMGAWWMMLVIWFGATDAVAIAPQASRRQFHAPLSVVEIEASVLFSEPGEFGAYPIRMRIKNGTGEDLTWRVTMTSGRNGGWSDNFVSNAELVVPKGESKQFELFTVLLPNASDGYNSPQTVRIGVRGYGVGTAEHTFAQPYRDYKLAKLPYVVLSPEIALRSASVLASEFTKASKAFPGVTIDLKILPEDWRLLTGTAAIWMSLGEWHGLSTAQADAMASWMLLGGKLVLFSSQGSSLSQGDLRMPFLGRWDGSEGRYGLGRVEVVAWDGYEVSFPDALALVSEPASLPVDPGERPLSEIWRLVDRVPAPELNTFLVVTLLFIYAVVVGPLNLRYSARRGARQLLFVTTPVIAAVSCVVLFGLIVMRDGFGGWGSRAAAVLIEGKTNRAVVAQEQLSRTGVLLDDSVSLSSDYLMIPLNLFKRGYRSERLTYVTNGNEYTSGWLNNRARQGQLVFGVVPTRARITHIPSSRTVVSSIETELKTIFVKDEKGLWWKATKVLPGRPAKLAAATSGEFLVWSQGSIERVAGPSINNQLSAMRGEPSVFFAEAVSDGGFSIPAFKQFDWEHAATIFYGPL